MRRTFFTIMSLILACLPLAAQESGAEKTVAEWYRSNERAAVYKDIRNEITAIVARGDAALIPGDAVTAILDEAVSKGAPPDRIVAALTARIDELIRIKALLDRTHECLSGSGGMGAYDPASLLRNCALFLRRGITPGVIEEVFNGACARGKNFTAAIDALRTLANIPSLGEIPAPKIGALGNAILGSGLSPSGYTALSSVYIKGKLKNLKAVDITDIIISVLREGKGLVRIEQEMNRRGGQ